MKRTSDSLLDDDVDDVEEEDDEKEGERKSQSAFGVLLEESVRPRLVTFVPELDHLLGGGIPTSCITELCLWFFSFFIFSFHSSMDGFQQQTDGVPGIGKTQLCLQLCANSHMPSALGGLGGGALFIGLFFFQLGATHTWKHHKEHTTHRHRRIIFMVKV